MKHMGPVNRRVTPGSAMEAADTVLSKGREQKLNEKNILKRNARFEVYLDGIYLPETGLKIIMTSEKDVVKDITIVIWREIIIDRGWLSNLLGG